MFTKLLLKKVQSLSPEEKDLFRKALEVNKSDKVEEVKDDKVVEEETKESEKVDDEKVGEEKKEEGENKMAEEKVSEEKEKSEVEETTKDTDASKVSEEEVKEEKTETESGETPEVEEMSQSAEGISIKDLVTKEELFAKFEAFEAKYDAVVKENEDLKNRLSQMEDKYENKDFGSVQRKGIDVKNNSANDTFEAYSRQFM